MNLQTDTNQWKYGLPESIANFLNLKLKEKDILKKVCLPVEQHVKQHVEQHVKSLKMGTGSRLSLTLLKEVIMSVGRQKMGFIWLVVILVVILRQLICLKMVAKLFKDLNFKTGFRKSFKYLKLILIFLI